MSNIDENNNTFQIQQRRYIGNKNKLMPWIRDLIIKYTTGESFYDVFAGTGAVTNAVINDYNEFYINDFLFSNELAFEAFFGIEKINWEQLITYQDKFNSISERSLDDSYFSKNFGGKFFSEKDAEVIGEIREIINQNDSLSKRERAILVTSLIYSVDHIANTVGHYDAFRKNQNIENRFVFRLIEPLDMSGKKVSITRKDANDAVKDVKADVVFLDPPYNSRQYSRFYHVLENIAKWDKPKLYGIAMKPEAENMSDYSRKNAPEIFDDLIKNINGKYIVVTYNNTYEDAKSSSSRNKITHDEILKSLKSIGNTRIFNKNYRFFNAGNTDLNNHQEFVFITEVRK